ncbi:hypothetical protein F5Y14DRAFT_161847 [Nemania sp. NC0429]|nr:hypothetical protein F5Y14DRAFT_161847 [Nemania sp. NC0429]
MALELVAGHAFNLGLGNTFTPRDFAADVDAGALEARQDAGAGAGPKSVNIFIDSTDPEFREYGYAASVVDACPSKTVYALRCTAGPSGVCGAGGPAVTITENASQYTVSSAITTKTRGIVVSATAIEHCDLAGTTRAVCTATIQGEAEGQKYTTSGVVTYTTAANRHYDVAITGGNEKLANPTGKCSSAAAGTNTRAVALWGLLGAIGAVGVLAL